MQLGRRPRGFTLVEMAVVFTIVVLLAGSAIMTLNAMMEQRNIEEATRRLNAAVDAIIGFAVVNRRLPCPAVASATGVESPSGGGTCSNNFSGLLPAQTIGFAPTDANGYGVDVWGNQIRYAVAGSVALTGSGCPGALPHLTSQANLKSNGISCKPGTTDLDICTTSSGVTATSCNTAPRVAAQSTVAFIVYSQGKNWNVNSAWGADETQNNNGRVFISRTPTPSDSTQGAFDDIVVYVPIGVLYSKLIAAGALP